MTAPHPDSISPTPADWHVDPMNPQQLRYWDGAQWSGHVRPAHPGAPSLLPTTTSNGLAITAIVLGVIAVLFVPILFGTIGIVLGGVALSKGQPLARWGLGVAIAGTVAGMFLGALFAAGTF